MVESNVIALRRRASRWWGNRIYSYIRSLNLWSVRKNSIFRRLWARNSSSASINCMFLCFLLSLSHSFSISSVKYLQSKWHFFLSCCVFFSKTSSSAVSSEHSDSINQLNLVVNFFFSFSLSFSFCLLFVCVFLFACFLGRRNRSWFIIFLCGCWSWRRIYSFFSWISCM